MAKEVESKKGRNVVIAIDGSDHAKYAYQWYLDNIRIEDDNVYLVHAVEMHDITMSHFSSPFSFDPSVFATMLEQEKERVSKDLQLYVNLLTETGVSGTVKSVHATSPGEGIIKAAKDVEASLIISGCQGLSTIHRTLIGSNSDYILHHSEVPVIVCRKSPHH